MVYFIVDWSAAKLKIGCSRAPEQRLKALQTACPRRLELLGSIPGDHSRESELHREFAPYRGRGEWFDALPALIREVQWLLDVEACPTRSAEQRAVDELIDLLETHGWLALSIRGPLGADVDACVKQLARAAVAEFGGDVLHRVYRTVEQWATRNLKRRCAEYALYCLDHRFDGIGGWFA